MAINITGHKREFHLTQGGKTVPLSDPDPEMTPQQVMMLYSNHYPELTTSTVKGPKFENDVAVYEFKTTHGTKG